MPFISAVSRRIGTEPRHLPQKTLSRIFFWTHSGIFFHRRRACGVNVSPGSIGCIIFLFHPCKVRYFAPVSIALPFCRAVGVCLFPPSLFYFARGYVETSCGGQVQIWEYFNIFSDKNQEKRGKKFATEGIRRRHHSSPRLRKNRLWRDKQRAQREGIRHGFTPIYTVFIIKEKDSHELARIITDFNN